MLVFGEPAKFEKARFYASTRGLGKQRAPMLLNREAMLRHSPPDEIAAYTTNDAILYALSIGLGNNPIDRNELTYVYEDGLAAFPTMAFVIGWSSALHNPEFGIERGKQVVSGMGIELHRALPPEGRLLSRTRIQDVLDTGKGALINVRRTLSTEAGAPVATMNTNVFVRGAGNFGGPSDAKEHTPAPPQTAADSICDLPTSPNMALLYRLNGDRNPLHASPDFARKVGFERPILHGQASFAVAVHALIRSVTGYDVQRIRSVGARFVQPFYPGETLRTKFWLGGEAVVFRCWSVERNVVVIDHGRAVIVGGLQ
jgi:acyl dehydratase